MLIIAEVISESIICELTAADLEWLAGFGVDSSWMDDPIAAVEVNELLKIGSYRLDESPDKDMRQSVIVAREKFFEFVGIDEVALNTFKNFNPTLIPLNTFINTQRVFYELDLDAAKVINAFPPAIAFAPESVRAKVYNLTELGIDAAKVINAFPQAMSYATESIITKVNNLTELGLDAAKVINAFPQAIGYAPESVRAKVRLLDRTVNILKWEYKAKELIETSPSILGFNRYKLRILGRLAAEHITEQGRKVEPNTVKYALITPLEKYILEVSESDEQVDFIDLQRSARRTKISAPERKERVLSLAESGSLGRIGTMYIKYRS
jgi:hypothetical protein